MFATFFLSRKFYSLAAICIMLRGYNLRGLYRPGVIIRHRIPQCNFSKLSIYDRIQDKAHRSYLYSLTREVTRYKKNDIELQHNVSDLLVQLDFKTRRPNLRFIPPKNIPSQPLRANLMLESLTTVIIEVLMGLAVDTDTALTECFDRLALKRKNLPTNIVVYASGIDIEGITSSFIRELDVKEVDEKKLRLALTVFHRLAEQEFGGGYTVDDLVKWINSITAPNVTEACMALTHLKAIPGFVAGDIVSRTPMSKYELNLQVDMWYTYLDAIRETYHYKTSHLYILINNLVFYVTHMAPEKLPEFVGFTIKFFTNPRSSFVTKVFTHKYLCQLLWKLPRDIVESPGSKNTKLMKYVIKAQEIISSTLQSIDKSLSLSLEAYMGIVLAVSYVSRDKARQLFDKSQSRHMQRQHQLTSQELQAFHFVKISLARTPDDLLRAFHESTIEKKHISTVWLAFIQKLIQFDLLTVVRSTQILQKLVNEIDNVLITKNILLHLFLPVLNMKDFEQFLLVLQQQKTLLRANSSLLLEKYMIILYNSQKDPLNVAFLHALIPNYKVSLLTTNLSVARDLYHNYIKRKSASLLGRVLNGEAYNDPQDLYRLYKEQLEKYHLVPDESCLTALMKAAMLSPNPNSKSCYIWDNFYAPQLATHEFKANTIKTLKEPNYIFPSDELWQLYIKMLTQYDYTKEISEIVEWWVNIEFTPNYATLKALLRAMPPEFATRHISHVNKLKHDSVDSKTPTTKGLLAWPWPRNMAEIDS